MRTRHRFDVAAVLLAFVLSSAPIAARAAEEWILPSNPCGLAVTTDGIVWTAHRDYPSQAYLLRHDPNESIRVDLPQKLIAPTDLTADSDGGVWIIATSGIGHLARGGEVRTVSDTGASAGAVDSEGRLWAITYSYPPRIDIISSDGSVTKIDPGGFDRPIDIAFDRSGSAWITTWPEVLKVDRDGSVQRFPWEAHSYPWITRGRGDTMVGAGGIIAADGRIRSRPIVGEDGVVGADGRTWVARWRDLVVAVDDAGTEELFPTAAPRTGPWSDQLNIRIAAGVQNDLWATGGSSLRRIEVSEESPGLATRVGDVMVLQHEPNCCFEGSHPVITRHRRGTQPYVIEFDELNLRGMLPQFTTDGRPVGMTRRTISEDARTWTFVELSPLGDRTPLAEFTLSDADSVHAFFVHPNGEFWVLMRIDSRLSLRRMDKNGSPLDWIALPEMIFGSLPRTFDVEADGCTIGYFAGDDSVLRRFDVCTHEDVSDIALATNGTAMDFRFLRDGRVLVATEREVAVFGANGTRQRTYDGVAAVAMDVYDGYFWAASRSSAALRRIEFANGNAVEEIALYARPEAISVNGEQRASSLPPPPQWRRRAVQRN